MHQFDASSLVYAWDTYPNELFPKLWEWLKEAFELGDFRVCRVAMDEVGHVSPDCHDWLKDTWAEALPITEEILFEALRIKSLLGIEEDQYHPKGVDENDILIIASALVHEDVLISNESLQTSPQKDFRKRKIPAVCGMIDVECVNFTGYLKNNNRVFG